MNFDIQFNTANNVTVSEDARAEITSAVRTRLKRFEPRLSRIEMHFSDENGPRASSDEIRCMIEARPRSDAPVSVTGNGTNVVQAASVAAGKMLALLDSQFGKADRVRA